jgi:hypothetical protein
MAIETISRTQAAILSNLQSMAEKVTSNSSLTYDDRIEQALGTIEDLCEGMRRISAAVQSHDRRFEKIQKASSTQDVMPKASQVAAQPPTRPVLPRADLPTASTRPKGPGSILPKNEPTGLDAEKRRDILYSVLDQLGFSFSGTIYDKYDSNGVLRAEWKEMLVEHALPPSLAKQSYVSIARRNASQSMDKGPSKPSAQPPPKPAEWKTVSRDKGNQAQKLKTNAAVVPKKPPPQQRSFRPFSEDELLRVIAGEKPRADRQLTALYVVGLKAQPISIMKRVLKGNCGIALRHVPHIGFIDRELMELHVYEDYAEKLKELVLAKLPARFIGLDEAQTTVSRAEYIESMKARLKATPVPKHRAFLSALIGGATPSLPPSEQEAATGDLLMLA